MLRCLFVCYVEIDDEKEHVRYSRQIIWITTLLMNVSSEVTRVLDVCGGCCGVISGIGDTKTKLRAKTKGII